MAEALSTSQIDWTGFIKRIYVDTSKSTLWRALATAQGIASWFTHITELFDSAGYAMARDQFAESGNTVHWEWTEGTSDDAKVISVNPGESIRFSWYGDKGWVEFRVGENDGRVWLELEQRMESDDVDSLQDAYVGCLSGWVFFMANLKSVLQGGLDLREFRPDTVNLVNA